MPLGESLRNVVDLCRWYWLLKLWSTMACIDIDMHRTGTAGSLTTAKLLRTTLAT
jgi:hypothetical protein